MKLAGHDLFFLLSMECYHTQTIDFAGNMGRRNVHFIGFKGRTGDEGTRKKETEGKRKEDSDLLTSIYFQSSGIFKGGKYPSCCTCYGLQSLYYCSIFVLRVLRK